MIYAALLLDFYYLMVSKTEEKETRKQTQNLHQ